MSPSTIPPPSDDAPMVWVAEDDELAELRARFPRFFSGEEDGFGRSDVDSQ